MSKLPTTLFALALLAGFAAPALAEFDEDELREMALTSAAPPTSRNGTGLLSAQGMEIGPIRFLLFRQKPWSE